MRQILPDCCARAASGQLATAPPRSVMNSRRRMRSTPVRTGGSKVSGGILPNFPAKVCKGDRFRDAVPAVLIASAMTGLRTSLPLAALHHRSCNWGKTGPTMALGAMALGCPRIEDIRLHYPLPRPFAACEQVSGGDRSLGQSWDGNGCQSQQDDERLHGASPCYRPGSAGFASAGGRSARACDAANYARV